METGGAVKGLEVTDELWERIEPLLPAVERRSGGLVVSVVMTVPA